MNGISKKTVEESREGVLKDISGKKNLLVTFGGIQQGIGIPVYEFFNSVQSLDCDKLYFRDFEQAWYQKGVDDVLRSTEDVTRYIAEITSRHPYKRICFLGNSMGAYAAILFGLKLNVDHIIGFAPQTFFDRKSRWLNRDFRWKAQINAIYKSQKLHTNYDLRNIFNDNSETSTVVDIFFSPKHRLDRIHAERLKQFSSVTLHPIDEGGHSVVKAARDSGLLKKVLENSLM